MPVFPKPGLLTNKHLNKGFAVFFLLELLEKRLLSLRHGASDAMPFTLELANVDAGTWCLGHLRCLRVHPLLPDWPDRSADFVVLFGEN